MEVDRLKNPKQNETPENSCKMAGNDYTLPHLEDYIWGFVSRINGSSDVSSLILNFCFHQHRKRWFKFVFGTETNQDMCLNLVWDCSGYANSLTSACRQHVIHARLRLNTGICIRAFGYFLFMNSFLPTVARQCGDCGSYLARLSSFHPVIAIGEVANEEHTSCYR